MSPPPRGSRRLVVHSETAPTPLYVVWELTLACDQPCVHCGSRAKLRREVEISTARALEVVKELAAMGTREVVLIGGEAYLHPGFLRIVRALADEGIKPLMTTGGRGITEGSAMAMREAGLARVSVSIDGLEETHDLVRANRGSFRAATAALHYLRDAGIQTASNINLNRINRADLEGVYAHLRECGISSWQVQLTAPLGRAADRPGMLLQPYDLLDVVPRIAALKRRAFEDGILLLAGNNLGYFGPEEGLLRSQDPADEDHFHGCQAGRFVMGIESDGAVKGCPSLQTRTYVGGNLQSESVADAWKSPVVGFARARDRASLWGFCATCPFAETCMAGCTFTAHSFFGKPGNQPYCHFRAREMQKRGLRERLVRTEKATGLPFDHGKFELVTEPFADDEADEPVAPDLVQLRRRARAE